MTDPGSRLASCAADGYLVLNWFEELKARTIR
jgi:hypothetical protein